MNISFKYDNGDKKIIVSNENGKLTEIDYTDNIEELLIQQNIIESLEKEINSLQITEESLTIELQDLEEKEKKQKEEKKSVKKNAIEIFCGLTIGLTIIFVLISNVYTLKMILSIGAIDACLAAATSMCYIKLNQIENPQLDLETTKLALDAIQKKKIILSKALEKEKRKYKELQENQSREKELHMQKNNQITIVNYRTKLEQIKNEIMDDIGNEMISEFDNNQTLALGYGQNIENSENSN